MGLLFKRLHGAIQVRMCRFCVSLEKKGAPIIILIYYESFINFDALLTLRITTTVAFYVSLSFIGAGKARSVRQSLVLSRM